MIKDVRFGGRGKVSRFWATYEQHCERTGGPVLFGTVEVGEHTASTPEAAFPAAVEWPPATAGTPGYPAPITIVGEGSGGKVASVRLGGVDANEFEVVSDGL